MTSSEDAEQPQITTAENVSTNEKFNNFWGGLVVVAASLNCCIVGMKVHMFSIIYKYHFDATDISTTEIAWIFNLFQFMWDFSSSCSGPLVERFGHQKTGIIFGFLYAASSISTGLYTNANYLFLSCSILQGLGAGIICSVSQFIFPLYCTKRLGLAVGIFNIGLTTGQFIGPVLLEYLQETYSMYSLFIIGALELNICAFSLLFLPPNWNKTCKLLQNKKTHQIDSSSEPTSEGLDTDKTPIEFERRKGLATSIKEIMQKSFHNAKILRKPRVAIMTVCMGLLFVSYSNFIMLVPLDLEHRHGHSQHVIQWCLSAAGISNLISRLIVPAVTDCLPISSIWYVLFGSLLMGLSQVGFSLVENEVALVSMMVLFGFSLGFNIALWPILMIELMGLEMLPTIWGANSVVLSISFITLGPIIGEVRDITQSYVFCIGVAAALTFASTILWGLMPCVIARDRRNEQMKKTQS